MIGVTYAEASASRVRGGLNGSWNSTYIGSKTDGDEPHAFIVEGEPRYTIRPHFHEVNQFQVCAGGRGTLGKSPLVPGVLHYADAYTPYGPIVASDDGLTFFTLRQQGGTGTFYMPGSKAEQKQPTGRNIVVRAELERCGTSGVRVLMEQPDGVAVLEVALAAGEELPDLRAGRSNGAGYLLVFEGALTGGGREYPERSLVYVKDGELPPALRGGPRGALAGWMAFAATSPHRLHTTAA